MLCGLNAKKIHCLISNTENLVAKIRSVKFSFLLSISCLVQDVKTSFFRQKLLYGTNFLTRGYTTSFQTYPILKCRHH